MSTSTKWHAFAAVNEKKGIVDRQSVRSLACDARRAAGEGFDSDDWERGWELAKQAGYRIKRVMIEVWGRE